MRRKALDSILFPFIYNINPLFDYGSKSNIRDYFYCPILVILPGLVLLSFVTLKGFKCLPPFNLLTPVICRK